jgi:hypothetical protein
MVNILNCLLTCDALFLDKVTHEDKLAFGSAKSCVPPSLWVGRYTLVNI